MTLAAAALAVAGISGNAPQGAAGHKAYLIGQVRVLDHSKYDRYREVVPAIIQQFNGRYLARGGRTVTLEGPIPRERVVVVEFPSVERAQEFYRSADYESARQLRAGAADVSFVVVEGL
jgi:uncharacterized protein (DUF1330 family)